MFVVATESHVVRRRSLCTKTHQDDSSASAILRWKRQPFVYSKVAGIDSDSGALIWRHAQEAEDLGAVRALKVRVFQRLSLSFLNLCLINRWVLAMLLQ